MDLHQSLQNTLVLILAGGRGSRLHGLTENQTKPALPFGGKFRIIDFPLSNCINSGIRRIAVATQYRAHTLLQHLQHGWGFLRSELNEFVEIWPAQQQTSEESWYRGTADAVFQNIQTIRGHAPQHILVLAGDHVYKQNYGLLLADHIERGAHVTVACIEVPRKEATAFGVVGVDADDKIVSFLEKPRHPPAIPGQPDKAFASMGIYMFDTKFLLEQLQRDAADAKSSHDFGKDILPYLVSRHRVLAHRYSRSCVMNPGTPEVYWRDVGTLDAYWAANLDLTKVTPALDLYDASWPIWTYQIQRPAAKFVFDDDDRRGLAVDSVISAGCIVSGGRVRRSLLFNDVRVNSYAEVEDCVLLPSSEVGRGCRLRRAIIESGCRIPAGFRVGEDPEEDARRFYRTESGLTLVTRTGLKA